jgi:hypothetical protein
VVTAVYHHSHYHNALPDPYRRAVAARTDDTWVVRLDRGGRSIPISWWRSTRRRMRCTLPRSRSDRCLDRHGSRATPRTAATLLEVLAATVVLGVLATWPVIPLDARHLVGDQGRAMG